MEEPRRFILYSIAFVSFQRYLNWINRLGFVQALIL